MLKRLFFILAIFVLLPLFATGQAIRPGYPGAQPTPNCQFNPQPGEGEGNGPSCLANIPWYLTANTSTTACGSNGVGATWGNGVDFVADADANFNTRIFVTYPVPSPAVSPTPVNYNAAVCDYDRTTGAFIAGGLVNGGTTICLNATAGQSSNNGHMEPAIVDLSAGYVGVEECGPNSKVAGQWGGGSGGPGFGPGTSFPAMPFAIGNCVGATDCANFGTGNMDITSASNFFYLPVSGLSEGSGGQFGGVTLICGQNQGSTFQTTISTGSQTCATIHKVPGVAQWTLDTACTPGAALTSYNIVTGTISTACNAMMTFQYNVHSDIMGWQDFTTDTSGTMTVTFPANGAFAGSTCHLSLTGTGTTDATNFAAAIHSGAGFSSVSGTCTGSGLTNYYDAYAATNCTASTSFSPCTVGQTVFVLAKNANPPTMAAITTSSTGTLVAWNDGRTNTAGTLNHFDYGTFQLLYTMLNYPVWCGILDNQIETHLYTNNTVVGANNYALNARILCSHGPGYTISNGTGTAGVWHWGTAEVASSFGSSPADGFDQTVSPATATNVSTGSTPPPGNFTPFIGPWTSCPNDNANTACTTYASANGSTSNVWGFVHNCDGVTCTTPSTMVPFIFSMDSQTQGGLNWNGSPAPMYTNYGLLIDKNNNIGFFWSCPDNVLPGPHTMVCYATVSTTTGQTLQQVIVDALTTDNNANTPWNPNTAGVRTPNGDLVLLIAVQHESKVTGCSAAPCFIKSVSTDNGAHWTNTILGSPSWAGADQVAVDCEMNADPKGWHIYAACWPGAGTGGSTSFYQYDLYTGNL